MYIKCSDMSYLDHCKQLASDVADEIMEFQEAITGDPILSDYFTPEQIETIDEARSLLYMYSDEA